VTDKWKLPLKEFKPNPFKNKFSSKPEPPVVSENRFEPISKLATDDFEKYFPEVNYHITEAPYGNPTQGMPHRYGDRTTSSQARLCPPLRSEDNEERKRAMSANTPAAREERAFFNQMVEMMRPKPELPRMHAVHRLSIPKELRETSVPFDLWLREHPQGYIPRYWFEPSPCNCEGCKYCRDPANRRQLGIG